ncbi:MAG TPA: DUF805 domain-containing protein [Steroidobacteraceae bacterium]|nr:DUF805 domain-containing protein [Steroidobacteraceae bacterium]
MATNPYAAPQAEVRDIAAAQEFQEIRFWSATGRIGRLRYLAYVFGFQMLLGVVAGIAGALLPQFVPLIAIPAYLVLLVFSIIQAIKRSHDMDWSGWMVLLMLIPLVGLIWLFKRGTEGENRFGHPPPPNTTLVKVLGILMPLLFVVGIVAAIVIPAYSDYVQRAQGLQ